MDNEHVAPMFYPLLCNLFCDKRETLPIIIGFIANKAESSRLNIGATFPEGVQGHMQSPGEAEQKQQKVIGNAT